MLLSTPARQSLEALKTLKRPRLSLITKTYINREEGFIGTGLKRDEYICDCSDIDDIILFYDDGRYIITKVQEKAFVGKGVIYAGYSSVVIHGPFTMWCTVTQAWHYLCQALCSYKYYP